MVYANVKIEPRRSWESAEALRAIAVDPKLPLVERLVARAAYLAMVASGEVS